MLKLSIEQGSYRDIVTLMGSGPQGSSVLHTLAEKDFHDILGVVLEYLMEI